MNDDDGDEKAEVGGNRRNDMGFAVVGLGERSASGCREEGAKTAQSERGGRRNGADLDNLQTLKGKKEGRRVLCRADRRSKSMTTF